MSERDERDNPGERVPPGEGASRPRQQSGGPGDRTSDAAPSDGETAARESGRPDKAREHRVQDQEEREERRPREPQSSEPKPRPRRRRRGRRFVVRALVAILLLLLLAAGVVHVLFQTAVPRRLVVAMLQKELGLRISAAALDTGWAGRTELRDVTLALPLADEAFLTVPRLRLEHTSPLLLAVGRPFRVEAIELWGPRLVLRQDALGRWNVREATALATRAGGGRSAAAAAGGGGAPARAGTVQLPDVRLHDGSLLLIDNDQRRIAIDAFQFAGRPETPVSWSFELALGAHGRVTGRIAPGGAWEHALTVERLRLDELLASYLDRLPRPVHLAGRWLGTAGGSAGLAGRFELTGASVGDATLSGAASLRVAGGGAEIVPETLAADVPAFRGVPVRFTSGAIHLAGTRVEARELVLALFGGSARLAGHYDYHAQAAEVRADWTGLALPGAAGGSHAGSLSGALETPFPGRPRINASLVTRGSSPAGAWDARLDVAADGETWSRIDWRLSVPRLLAWRDDEKLDLRDLRLRLASDGKVVRLAELSAAGASHVAGKGEYDLATGRWSASADLRGLSVPRITRTVDLALDASGDAERIDLHRLDYAAGRSHVTVRGAYVYALPKPLDVTLELDRLPFAVADPGQRRLTTGALRASARATGTLAPLDVELVGDLRGQEVHFGRRRLGDISSRIEGRVADDLATVRTRDLRALDGDWAIGASYRLDDGSARLDIRADGLSLTQLDALVEPPPDLRGTLSLALAAGWSGRRGDAVTLAGQWSVRDLARSALVARRVDGKLALEGDTLVLSDIVARQQDGRLTGRVAFDLRGRRRLDVELQARDFPIDLPDGAGRVVLNADAAQVIDLVGRSAAGPLTASASLAAGGRDLGTASVEARLDGRLARVHRLEARAFDGVATGGGVAFLDDWPRSTGRIEVTGLNAAALVEMFPGLAGLRGRLSGSVELRQSRGREAPEPLIAQVRLRPEGVEYNGAALGDSDLAINAGRNRVVLTASQIEAAGGRVFAWARLSHHTYRSGGSAWFAHLQAELQDLDMNVLARAASPSAAAGRVDGRLSGEVTLYGPPREPYRAAGEARLRVRDSGLLNIDLLAGLYRALNPGAAPPPPQGRGSAFLRLERGTLTLVNAFYRNRNIYVRGALTAQDVFAGQASPISGYAVGTARPLSQIKLPLLPEIDDLFEALQSAFTTFRIGGTLGKHTLDTAAFSQVGTDLRHILVGDVRAETAGSASR